MAVTAGALTVAAVSLLLVAPAPSYDPWAWLTWGREITRLDLSTADGPAFKPLPVALCAVLTVLGDTVAPVAWVWLARAAALLALVASFDLASRLSGGRTAGVLAVLGVAMTGSFLGQAASGLSEPMLVALALSGAASARAGHVRAAVACAAGCALIRVETWPFLLLAAVVAWRRFPRSRPVLLLLAASVPLAWFGPELLGSGDALRSGSRARIPNPGQPALAPIPALASLEAAVSLVPWILWLGAVALVPAALRPGATRPVFHALAPALVGGAWLVLVALMAQAGFSGEPRYALPGAALISISGAVGLMAVARVVAPRLPAVAAALLLAGPTIADRGDDVEAIPAAQAHHWKLSADLRGAIDIAGGRSAILACGTPYVGPYRGTLAAYQLDVAKHVVEPDRPPRAPGMAFQSRLRPASRAAPPIPAGFTEVGDHGAWRIGADCAPSRVRVP
jgi:hypothetical protein